MAVAAMKRDKYYDELGVKPDAKPDEIKRAYRKKAKSHHPDKAGDSEAFMAIQKAYDILGDEARRKRYDETGDDNTNVFDPMVEAVKILLDVSDEMHDGVDLHEVAIEQIRNAMQRLARQQVQCEDKAKSLRAKAKRWRHKGQSDNPVTTALVNRADSLDRQANKIGLEIGKAKQVLKALKEFDYECEKHLEITVAMSFTDWAKMAAG